MNLGHLGRVAALGSFKINVAWDVKEREEPRMTVRVRVGGMEKMMRGSVRWAGGWKQEFAFVI